MDKDFARYRMEIVNFIHSKQPIPLQDITLWIYLSLYYYPRQQMGQGFSREAFLKQIEDSLQFHPWLPSLKEIPKEAYGLLKELILEKYSHLPKTMGKKLSLKGLEEGYEKQLLKGIRSKTGSYYTPEPIVKAMVLNSLWAFFLPSLAMEPQDFIHLLQGEGIANYSKEVLEKLYGNIQGIKLGDISCGGGVFLREALQILVTLKQQLAQGLGIPFDMELTLKDTLGRQLYGMDIQPHTVALCQVLLLMEADQLMGEAVVESIPLNIYVGDSLGEDGSQCLPRDFDIILGNPPYIGERGNRSLFEAIKKTPFGQRYYEGKMDYFYFFFYRGWELLKEGGILAYIVTNYFVTADGAQGLRGFIAEQMTLRLLVNFQEISLFKGAKGQHNLIVVATKGKVPAAKTRIISFHERSREETDLFPVLIHHREGQEASFEILPEVHLYDHRGQLLIQGRDNPRELFDRILQNSPLTLGTVFHINQGIVSGADTLSQRWAETLNCPEGYGQGIFVLTPQEIQEKGLDAPIYQSLLKPFYKNSDIKQYTTLDKSDLRILYLDDDFQLDENQHRALWRHLMPYRPLLESRREVRLGRRKWYALQWPRNKEVFLGEKIVVPQRSAINAFAYQPTPWFASADVYYLTLKDPSFSYDTMIGLLNSSLIYYWLYHRGKRKGKLLELYSTPLKSIPLPWDLTGSLAQELGSLSKAIIQALKQGENTDSLTQEINHRVYRLYDLTPGEQKVIETFHKERKETL